MAIVTGRDFKLPFEGIDIVNDLAVTGGATQFVLQFPPPGTDTLTFEGSGFGGYGATGFPSSGVVTRFFQTESDDNGVDFDITGLSIDVAVMQAFVDANDGVGLSALLFSGDDTMTVTGQIDPAVLNGYAGDDTLTGGPLDDAAIGGAGDDRLSGLGGDDSLFGGFGKDRAVGGGGNDFILTGPDNDTLIGGAGDDTLGASNRTDLLRGGDGKDLLLGSNGNDRVFGDAGSDTLLGGNGRDTIEGGDGNDRVIGGGGNDRMRGGAGDDVFRGDAGNDRYAFFAAEDGDDTILDFQAGAGSDDIIVLIGYGAALDSIADVQAAASQSGADTVIDLGGGSSLTLAGVNVGDLHQDDFVFG